MECCLACFCFPMGFDLVIVSFRSFQWTRPSASHGRTCTSHRFQGANPEALLQACLF